MMFPVNENSLYPLTLKGGEFSDVHPLGQGQKHQKMEFLNMP